MKHIFRQRFLKYHLPLYIYIGGIFALSSIPGSSAPTTTLPIDKVAHFIEYGILGFLLFRIIASSGRISRWIAVLLVTFLAAALGALDEFYQSTTGRNPSVYDWLFDCLGASVASIFLALYSKIGKKQDDI